MSDIKKEEKQIVDDKELDIINGGRRKPGGTWIPVDESCPVINCYNECEFPSRKGRYDNCHGCKHFK